MPEGTVKFFNETKGYGFIKPDKENLNENARSDVFVHVKELKKRGLERLLEGQRVKYDLDSGSNGKGPKAIAIEVL